MSAVKIALVQMRSGVDPARNIDDAGAMIREAAANGARLVATPEITNLVQRDSGELFDALRTPGEDPALVRFSDLAQTLGIDLLVGSLALLGPDGRAVNRSCLFGPDGALKASYDKIHMFDVSLGAGEVYSESENYAPGDRAVMADAAGLKLGMTICYDVRFPYLYRRWPGPGPM